MYIIQSRIQCISVSCTIFIFKLHFWSLHTMFANLRNITSLWNHIHHSQITSSASLGKHLLCRLLAAHCYSHAPAGKQCSTIYDHMSTTCDDLVCAAAVAGRGLGRFEVAGAGAAVLLWEWGCHVEELMWLYELIYSYTWLRCSITNCLSDLNFQVQTRIGYKFRHF